MCGITGYWLRGRESSRDRADLADAVRRLAHRGPDDAGTWFSATAPVGFGHARLSVLDLSRHGHQPMVDADRGLAMVYNGEIYNFREIRRDLEALGHAFHGDGDSEVLLHAFAEWGLTAIDRCIGMFAAAFWDERASELTLVRDRLGVKPLYYSFDGEALRFGSELRALMAFGGLRLEIDRVALGEFLQYGCIAAPRSILRGVFKLPPAHALVLHAEGELRITRYWSVLGDGDETDAERPDATANEDELVEQLEALLVDAFRYRMVSDVPVGVFLSGGIDSSLVTALLRRHTSERIRTYTIGFSESWCDESPFAQRIADHLETEHTHRTLSSDEFQELMERWGEIYDEPFGDSSGVPTYLVSKLAREEVTVALSADGGDELFAGYRHYRRIPRLVARLQRVPRPLRALAASCLSGRTVAAAARLSSIWSVRGNGKWVDRLRKLAGVVSQPDAARVYDAARSFWSEADAGALVGGYASPRERCDAYDGELVEQLALWDLNVALPDDILTKVDRATMAVSLEGREPLLDHRVAEFAFRLPLALRLGPLGGKHLLRRVLYRYVPRELLERPKQGFGIPLRDWMARLLSDPERAAAVVETACAGDVLRRDLVEDTIRSFRRGERIDANRVWLLYAFAKWREAWKV